MIVFVAAALTLSPAANNRDLVAVVARIYYKSGDKRVSRSGIYLCGLHGEHRHLIARPPFENAVIWWRDRNHLRWAPTADRYGTGTQRTYAAFDFDIRRMQAQQIVVSATELSHSLQSQFLHAPASFDIQIGSKKAQFKMGESIGTCRLAIGGKDAAVSCSVDDPGDLMGYLFDARSKRLWLCTELGFSTWGPTYGIYLFDSRRVELVSKIGGHEIDFSPRRDLYAGVEHRDLAPYTSAKKVWVARAFAGNWQTGEEWTVLDGLAEATWVALRPD
ncbi:MAG: hypothetical protein P4L46_21140 [Fimbriimonas sp.]|nr:hypothetical protein [Fimbriimonas sp.]